MNNRSVKSLQNIDKSIIGMFGMLYAGAAKVESSL